MIMLLVEERKITEESKPRIKKGEQNMENYRERERIGVINSVGRGIYQRKRKLTK